MIPFFESTMGVQQCTFLEMSFSVAYLTFHLTYNSTSQNTYSDKLLAFLHTTDEW